jgi:putative colanic acid biosynthesis UDP-glucose lipid carrier transferase
MEAGAQAVASIRGSNIEEIIISADPTHWAEIKELLSALRVLPLPVKFIPAGPLLDILKQRLYKIGDTLAVELQSNPRKSSELLARRALDILVSTTGLIMFLPLLLITAVAIKFDSSGPIIFRQRRCGFNGRQFQIFKFRTMVVQEDDNSVVQARRNDHRVTRLGKWLRRTSIDELPQLLNVLKGNMSIVGPRPHALAHDNEFDKTVRNYAFRHHVKPGITGWAQVNGYRGETRSVDDIKNRVKFDLWYIDNWTLFLDVKIIMMTIFTVLKSRNAY